jgi:hypothetical protein
MAHQCDCAVTEWRVLLMECPQINAHLFTFSQIVENYSSTEGNDRFRQNKYTLFGNLIVTEQITQFPVFMEAEASVSCLQKPCNILYLSQMY